MGLFSKTRRTLYHDASILGDADALLSGNPKTIEQHWVRKFLYKMFGSLMRRLF